MTNDAHSPTITDQNNMFATTESQKEIWIASQIGEDACCAFNESVTVLFNGPLHVDRLRAALKQLSQRHDSLRVTFSPDGEFGEIHPRLEIPCPLIDLSDVDESSRSRRFHEIVRKSTATPFDLNSGPLIRMDLVRFAEFEHRLVLSAHHSVCDGWSLEVLMQDLGSIYSSLVRNEQSQLKPAESFRDYAILESEAHLSSEFSADIGHWLELFANCPEPLDLPSTNPRPGIKTYRAGYCAVPIRRETTARLKQLSTQRQSSFLNTLLSIFSAFVYKLTGSGDFVIGIPSAGQPTRSMPSLVGQCVNLLPLRLAVDGADDFDGLVRRTQSRLLDAYDHQQMTFGALLKQLELPRDPSRLPLVSVMFNLDTLLNPDKIAFDDLDVSYVQNQRQFENFDLSLNVEERMEGHLIHCHFNADLFESTTIEQWMESYAGLLARWPEDQATTISHLTALSVKQQQTCVFDWNNTDFEYPRDLTIPEAIFDNTAPPFVNETAVTDEQGNNLTYGELERRSNAIASYLSAKGAQPGVLIGIAMERSVRLVEAVLGILKTGASYVPLDPEYPHERLAYMVDDSDLSLIVTETSLEQEVEEFGVPLVLIDSEVDPDLPTEPFNRQFSCETCAYVIYTSGSTGKPKGVQISHRAALNFLFSMKSCPGMSSSDRLLAVTTLSFDISVLELLLPLLSRACCVIASRESANDGTALRNLLNAHNISLLQATPSTWRMLIDSGWNGNKRFTILCGGEPMPADLVGPLLERCGSLWNMYGPTETTVWSTCFQIKDASARILIGKPIANTQVYVLDEQTSPVPVNVPGELYIAGDGVALGYLNRPELSRSRFVANPFFDPFKPQASPCAYRTGDLVRWRPDGNIEFLRRVDRQVKLRGHRIELGEIEHALSNHEEVHRAAAIVREDHPGDARLVAYVVPHPNESPTSSELRAHLRDTLPFYMIPQHFMELDALPLTNNGKIDYKALPAPLQAEAAELEPAPPETATQQQVAAVWQQLLGVEQVNLYDNFFELGGHSLLAVRCVAQLEELTHVRLGMRALLADSLQQIAETLERAD